MNRSCKFIAILLGAAWVSVTHGLAAEAAAPAFLSLPLAAALERASAEKKPVFVDFFVTWCRPCKQMDETTWKDEKVRQQLRDQVIAIRINTDEQPELAKKYQVLVHPTLALIAADGKIIDRMVGYVKPDEFVEDLTDALKGKNGKYRAKRKWMKAGENNPVARLEYAKALEFSDDPAGALEQYLWCWDESLKHDPSFRMARRTFLLSEWSRFAKTYAPAKEALTGKRAELAQKIQGGEDSLKPELNALNRFLALP